MSRSQLMATPEDLVTLSLDRLSERDYRRLAGFIEEETGIRMPAVKRTMVEGRLRRRVLELGMTSFADYCCYLFDEQGLATEQTRLIDAVTTNKTDFFREPDHFDFLTRQALPQLLAQRRPGAERLIKVWSAAASIGAEAYTAAMVLADELARYEFDFRILGTDICTTVLDQAAAAVYPLDMMEPVPDEMQRHYVMRSIDRRRQQVRIVPELRSRTRFHQLNLMDLRYPVEADMDVIFCRNVLIYFDKPTQHAVLTRLVRHLRPGGYLFLGHAESLAGAGLPVVQAAPSVFIKSASIKS